MGTEEACVAGAQQTTKATKRLRLASGSLEAAP